MTAFDASVLYGAVERRGTVVAVSRRVLDLPSTRITSEACVTEAMYIAGNRLGWKGQDRLWATQRTYRVTIMPTDFALAERLMRRYQDVPMDFADATLVALASERPRMRIATFDSDFLAYRRDDGTPVPLVEDRLLGWPSAEDPDEGERCSTVADACEARTRNGCHMGCLGRPETRLRWIDKTPIREEGHLPCAKGPSYVSCLGIARPARDVEIRCEPLAG